nr:retrovirus-related Pol polyprotein from transposon TNT 1-94 [Tanacetum cinerariifolium]
MRMNEQIARDAEVARIHAEEELQGMIDSLDKSNETIAKYLQEYQDFASELPLEKRIELISDLVKYQENYSKVYKFQSQQRRPMTKKQKRENYMAMIINNLGWKGRIVGNKIHKAFPLLVRKFPLPEGTSHFLKMNATVRRIEMSLPEVCTAIEEKKKKLPGSSQNNIDDKGYWDSGCSRHMTCTISYLSDFEPFDEGYVSFGQGGCKITGKGTIKTKCIVLGRDFKLLDDANVLLRTPRQHNMYSIDLNNIVPHRNLTCLAAKASADECMLWHRRLGHLNFKTMNKLVRHNLVRGLLTKCFENNHACTACLKGKQHKASCKSKLVNSVTTHLHTLHMDLFGPTFVSSISHKWYCLVVTDDFSRFIWTFFLKSKDKTSGILKKFITKIENLKDLKVKIIRCDNGGEFRNKEMNDFCSQKGIKREFSNARTPHQNGVAERRNKTLIEAARTMLADTKLPVTFWAEAVNTDCYVQNRVLVNKSHNKTSYELFNGRSHAIGFLKPFGCHVMILNTLDNLGKFEEKRDKGYFIGYSMSSKAFRVFNKRTRRVEENLHVKFLENKAIEKGAAPNWLFDIEYLTKSMNYMPVDAGTISTNISGTNDATSQEVKKNVSSLRYNALPNWAHDALLESSSSKPQDHCSADIPEGSGNPNPTVSTSNPPADPMEILTVESPIPTASSPNVWTLVDCPKGVRPIRAKWVLKNKKDERGIVIRNKAKLVAQRHIQEERIDYDEVFAPVVRIKAIRLFLAYALLIGFTVYQMDVKSAFLYGTIYEEVGTIDQTLFIRRKRGDFILVQVYVDDIIFGSSNPQLCREFEAFMHEKFQMSAMGDILKKFRYSDVRSSNTPMDKENPWGKDGTGKDVDLYLYRSMIGSLMYLTASRPDIMFAVCACARHQVTPKECHLHTIKKIFRYLKGHPKLGLWYLKESPFDLVAYSDSDYGGDTQDRKSTTEGCQFLRRRLISWQCKKQTIVATSTTEAEYVAAASCCGQVLWIQNQLLDYEYNFMSTKIYIDNNSVICIVKNPVYHSKTKHVEIRHHFIRDCFEKKLINVDHIHTDENVAGLLTKPFDAGRFQLSMPCEALSRDISSSILH